MNYKKSRLLSIDMFRGFTVALMIFVNALDESHGISWLSHSTWNGCTVADIVFPFFIFIVGVSVTLSLTKLQANGYGHHALPYKIIKRSLYLFIIGLALNAYPNHFDVHSLRIFGVLQRIAICYFFSAILFLSTTIRTQAIIVVILLLSYWGTLAFIPIPEVGVGSLTRSLNFAAYFDSLILAPQHLYHGGLDPEGLFSTIPAIATVLIGNITGALLLSNLCDKLKLVATGCSGIFLMLLGAVFGLIFPINKSLWTSSYVLWTAGIAMLVLAIFYWLVEIKNWQKLLKPFQILGVNAMSAFILHVLFLKTQAIIYVKDPAGVSINLRYALTKFLFQWTTLPKASLYYGIIFTLFWLLVIILFSHIKFSFKLPEFKQTLFRYRGKN